MQNTKQPANEDAMAWGLSVKTEVITPSVAAEYLERNTSNRTITGSRVNTLVASIHRNEWVLDGSTISFDVDGRLLDGQHRLTAIVKSGVPCASLVVRGVDRSAMRVKDTGKSRTPGDVLQIHGVKNATLVAAAVRSLICLEQTGTPLASSAAGRLTITPSMLLDHLRARPELEEGIRRCGNRWQKGAIGIFPLGPGIALYLVACRQERTAATEFFDTLYGREGGSADDPAWQLRERLLASGRGKTESLTTETKAAFLIKAWIAYRDNKPISRFFWRKFGRRAEAFPRMPELNDEEGAQ